jgi:hypothetical protein
MALIDVPPVPTIGIPPNEQQLALLLLLNGLPDTIWFSQQSRLLLYPLDRMISLSMRRYSTQDRRMSLDGRSSSAEVLG